MRALLFGLAALAAILAAAFYLKTPIRRFDREAAITASKSYDVRLVRDRYGVPHIYGARDADVAFGLAYAHAEDDMATLEDVLAFARGELGRRSGKEGAITDYLIAALGVWTDIDAKYERDLSSDTHAVLEGYAAGINFYCAEKRGRCAPGAAPVSAKDIVAGFAARAPFFYGLDDELKTLFAAAPRRRAAIGRVREAFLKVAPEAELGSNAIAVAPSRSADGHTRLMINSHQPYSGPVAWYEARVKSEDGLDMIGGVFPGSPVILHGAGPDLGWAHTVNLPDLVDVFALEVDDAKKPTRYKLDGEWRALERGRAAFRVKLFGPFSLPVTRATYRSVHGPAFVTPNGVVAISYGGQGDIRAVEQWRRMNKARDFESWRAAMSLQGIPSFNAIYADGTGMIAYFYNAAIPVRSPGQDWSKIADGTRGDLVWAGVRPFGTAPHVIAPASGYVVNANHTPFDASAPQDNPDPEQFPPEFGVDRRTTNRGLRIQALYGADESITEDEFIAYKMDDLYAPNSRLRQLATSLVAEGAGGDAGLAEALEVLRTWEGSTARESRGAALAVRMGQLNLGYRLMGELDRVEEPEPKAALKRAAAELKEGFGRIDPEWGETVRLRRGAFDLAIDGGPDTLRAVYPAGSPRDGPRPAAGGDTYIIYADWPSDGPPVIRTIHQFGAATLNKASPHYADQAPLFAGKRWKTPPMELEALLAEATSDRRLGR